MTLLRAKRVTPFPMLALAAWATLVLGCEKKTEQKPEQKAELKSEQKVDQNRDQAFWKWFEGQSARIHAFEKDQRAVFAELTQQLERVQKGLTFEFGPIENGVREFIVSADGIRERIPAVEALVKAAPKVEGFKIIPFRQRKSHDLVLEFSDKKLGVADIWFSHLVASGKVDIKLHIKDYTQKEKNAFVGATFLLLDIVLGEFDVMTRVGAIDFLPLPKDPAAKGLKPLKDLPAIVDETKK